MRRLDELNVTSHGKISTPRNQPRQTQFNLDGGQLRYVDRSHLANSLNVNLAVLIYC